MNWIMSFPDHRTLIPDDVSTCQHLTASWSPVPSSISAKRPIPIAQTSNSPYRHATRNMSSSTSLPISDELRHELIDKLERYRHLSDDTPDQGTTNGHDSTDSEQVLSAVLKSNKIGSEEQVRQAVDEYIGGKPLAYITGENRSRLSLR